MLDKPPRRIKHQQRWGLYGHQLYGVSPSDDRDRSHGAYIPLPAPDPYQVLLARIERLEREAVVRQADIDDLAAAVVALEERAGHV